MRLKLLIYARRAIEANPRSDTVYFEMAKAYRTQKEFEKSADAARRAIAINAQVPDYYYVLGLVLRELGQSEGERQGAGEVRGASATLRQRTA
jgi:tetratricopeptide (TPR) repeat protein